MTCVRPAVWRRLLGPTHADIAGTLNGLSRVYEHRENGDLANAAALFRQALTIFRKIGPADPHTAGVINNLALVTEDLGDRPAALALFREALSRSSL